MKGRGGCTENKHTALLLPAFKHAAEFKYHFVCIMWTSYCFDRPERARMAYTVLSFWYCVDIVFILIVVLGRKGI
jgi:hypothetical protein